MWASRPVRRCACHCNLSRSHSGRVSGGAAELADQLLQDDVQVAARALGIQEETKRLAVDVRERDGVDLQLRMGLNSGEVIAGEIGSGPFGYTTVGEQIGMAQRMESVASPGGVMLSASTARLVEGAATLGESELVQIKGADAPVPAGLRRPTSVAASCNQRRGAPGSFHTKRRPGVCPVTWPRRPRAQRRSRPQRATHWRR